MAPPRDGGRRAGHAPAPVGRGASGTGERLDGTGRRRDARAASRRAHQSFARGCCFFGPAPRNRVALTEDHALDTTVHAVILGAGQGRRLLPLTETSPKCLLRVGGRTMLEWQMRALAACDVREVSVITGFGADAVDAAAAEIAARVGVRARTRYNPFYAVADNAGSCYVARDLLRGGTRVLMNGDTLFEPAVLARALTAAAPVSVTVDRKAAYDADDMKVELDGTRLRAIGKTLPPERTGAESIGLLVFQGDGGALFGAALERVLRRPDGLRRWYLSAVDLLAGEAEVGTVSIEGLSWGEVDVPADLERAEGLVQGWLAAEDSAGARLERDGSRPRSHAR